MAAASLTGCLRLPISGGARLIEAPAASGHITLGDPDAESYPQVLVDNLNLDLLATMAACFSTDAYVLAFVSGSVVANRLGKARSYWRRIVQLFDLDPIVAALVGQFGSQPVGDTIAQIRRQILSNLLCDRTTVGPAILLFRVRKPTDDMLSIERYGAIQRFLSDFSRLSDDCDEEVKAILADTDLGDAQPLVATRLLDLLERFDRGGVAATVFERFDTFVRIQREARCLHPAVPIAPRAVADVARVLGLANTEAAQLINLFRFAWLCRLETTTDFSDFVPKTFAVVPHDDASVSSAHGEAALLSRTVDALQRTLRFQTDLQRFRAVCPQVQVNIVSFLMALPRPLFDLFAVIDDGDARLVFLTKYQMGREYCGHYVAELIGHARYRDAIGAIDARYHGCLSGDLDALLDQVVCTETKIKGQEQPEQWPVLPRDLSRRKVQETLEKTIGNPDKYMDKCVRMFDKTVKHDFASHLRGVWTLHQNVTVSDSAA